jgi:UDP-N-acetylmuramoyl-L-alanyl-D-glutamate--2,6-diaminopimelate ligase
MDRGLAEIEIRAVTDDSRRVAPGTLFVARRGFAVDGHDFVAASVRRGAVAVVSERPVDTAVPVWTVPDGRRALAQLSAAFYGDPTRSLKTIGVTGTNGKTSVCHFIAHLLGAHVAALIGTVVNAAGEYRSMTTASSPVVQQAARAALDAGKQFFVVEASSAGLEQHRLDEVDFDVAVFTNLTRDHLDLHGTMEAYGEAKASLFCGLKPGAFAVLNADDSFSAHLQRGTSAQTVRYGLKTCAEFQAAILGLSAAGTDVRLVHRGTSTDIHLPIVGAHSVSNALAALAAAVCCGVEASIAIPRLSTLPSVPGRWQTLERDGVTAVVDYAHTPDGLEHALRVMRAIYPRVILVFGCTGGSDRGRRAPMGRIAAELADVVVLTSDNPKDEDPEAILVEIEAGIEEGRARVEHQSDRAEAIAVAVDAARPGDGILVAGKGHETYQIVRGEFQPHSDVHTLEQLGFAEVSQSH